MRLFNGILGALIFTAPFAFAQNTSIDNNNELAIYGAVCEKISPDENKSSVRIRAADAASFKGIKNLPQLDVYKSTINTQEFNAKIYKLADNYLNSLNINTVRQDDSEICIEINAFLPEKAIATVFGAETKKERAIEDTVLHEDEFAIALPPKPNITINEEIAYQETPDKPIAEVKEIISHHETPNKPVAKAKSDKVQIFVDRTEFFDGNSTNKFFEYLQKDIEQNKKLQAINKPENPDYTLKTKVLKAKVDSLNAQTNRLQIVVVLTLTDAKTMKNFTEHQNRFILFSAEEDAQKTAAALIRKLFAAGLGKLLANIKIPESSQSKGLIITPDR